MTKHHRPHQTQTVNQANQTNQRSAHSVTVTTAMISAIAAISSSLITGVAAVMAPANIWQDVKTLPPFSKWGSTCPISEQDVRVETGDRILKTGDSTLISVHIANAKDLMLFVDWSSNLNGTFERLDGLGKTVRYTPNTSASLENRMQVDQIYLTIQDEPDRKCKLDLSTLVTISHDVGTQSAHPTPALPTPAASPAPSPSPIVPTPPAPPPGNSPSPTPNEQTVPKTTSDRPELRRSDNAKHPSKYSTIGMPKSDMRGRILVSLR